MILFHNGLSTMSMKTRLLIVHFLLMRVRADVTNDLLMDYFTYKKASSVVGYSCNNTTDDILLIKLFSKIGVAVVLNAWVDETKVHYAANANYYKIGIFLDTRCKDAKIFQAIYLDATNRRIYGELHYWLLLGDDLTEISKGLNDDAFGTTTDLVIAVYSEDDKFLLYDVYNKFKQRGAEMNITLYGDWTIEKGLNVSLLQLKSVRRSNLHGLKLKVLFYQSAYRPKNTSLQEYYQDRRDVTKDGRVKFGYYIIKNLADMYNFSIEFVESDQWLAGDTLGPLVRCLSNSSVDLSGTPIFANTERAKLMKFLHQGWPFRTCFIFRNPQPSNMKMQELFRPFAGSVWYLMVAFILASIIILAFALRLENEAYSQTQVAYSFTITTGAACQQCTDIRMTRLSTRVVFISIMLFSAVMYNFYSACVVSARLDEPIIKINDSLIELGKLNLKMASERMFFLNFFLGVPHWETQTFMKNYWMKIPESQRFMEPEIGINLVQKGQFAYHVHPDTGYALIDKIFNNREICELTEVHLANRLKTLFGVTNNSTVDELMKIGFAKISETGQRQVQLNRWQYRKPHCSKDILNASSINIYEFAPHLVLLILGMLASIFVGIIETIFFNWTREFPPSSQFKY